MESCISQKWGGGKRMYATITVIVTGAMVGAWWVVLGVGLPVYRRGGLGEKRWLMPYSTTLLLIASAFFIALLGFNDTGAASMLLVPFVIATIVGPFLPIVMRPQKATTFNQSVPAATPATGTPFTVRTVPLSSFVSADDTARSGLAAAAQRKAVSA